MREISPLLKIILNSKPQGIEFDSLSYERRVKDEGRDRILLYGRADTRNALLGFVESLREIKYFSKVHSPVSNLLQKQDIDFSLTVEL